MRKTVRGHVYWYAVESKRIDGKPRIVWQRYLGKMEEVIARCVEGPAAFDAEVYDFGPVAAVLSIAERLGFERIVEQHVPQGGHEVGAGRYLLLAAVNRVVAPKSKVQIGAWYERTVLRRLWGLPSRHFSSQRFWEAMDRVDEAALQAIEEDLARAAVREFGVEVRGLIYDATNFFTYIGTGNDAVLPQRGHNKQKRNDLKQVNLALLATADGHVPLLHVLYPGNVPDSNAFAAIYAGLAARCRALTDDVSDVALVFDKGNNSKDNLALLAGQQMHFVGSLVPSQHKDVLAVPLASYREVSPQRWPGLLTYRATKTVFGSECAVVATFDPALWAGQMQGLNKQRQKIEAALQALQAKLARWASSPPPRGKRPTAQSVTSVIRRLVRGREPGPFLRHSSAVDDSGVLRLTYSWDDVALQAMIDRHFGKTLLFTDQTDWPDEAIVAAYRRQAKIEDAFRQMKDAHFVSWRPLLHWTDQEVRVHAGYCVAALLFSSLLLQEVRRAGTVVGLPGFLETLASIKGVIDLPRAAGRNASVPVAIRLSRREQDAERLFQLLDLQRFHPERPTRPTGTTPQDR